MGNIITSASAKSPVGAKLYGQDALGNHGWMPPESVAANNRRGNTVVLLGDSLTSRSNYPMSITSITSSGTTATVNAPSHGLATGDFATINGATQTEYNGDYYITKIDTNNFSYTFAGSATSPATGNITGITQSSLMTLGMFCWMNATLNGALRLLANYGQSGASADDVYSMVDRALVHRPAIVFVLAGINSLTGGLSVDSIYLSIANACDKLRNNGVYVAIQTVTPLGSGHASNASLYPKICALNSKLKHYTQVNRGTVLIDAYNALVDPLSTSGAAMAGVLQSDNLHWAQVGAKLVGAAAAAAISWIVGNTSKTLCISAADIYHAANPKALLDNPFFLGTGGALQSGATGTVATGWTCYGLGSADTIVAGTGGTPGAARSDGYGNDQLMTVTSTALADGVILYSGDLSARVSPGDFCYAEADVSAADLSACIGYYIRASMTNTDGSIFYSTAPMVPALGDFDQADWSGVLKTPIFKIPSGGITAMAFQFRALFSEAGGGVFKIGRAQIRKVD